MAVPYTLGLEKRRLDTAGMIDMLEQPGSTPTPSSPSRTRWRRTTRPVSSNSRAAGGRRCQIIGDDYLVTSAARVATRRRSAPW